MARVLVTIAKSKSLLYYIVVYIKIWNKAVCALETEGLPVVTSVELGLQRGFLRQLNKQLRLLLYKIICSPQCPFFPFHPLLTCFLFFFFNFDSCFLQQKLSLRPKTSFYFLYFLSYLEGVTKQRNCEVIVE